MKTFNSPILLGLALAAFVDSARAANIVWVSDANDPAVGFFEVGSGYTDSAFVTLLQNAGHNVIRFNQPNSQNTLLTPEQIAALNTNDLIIIGRCVGSGAFQQGQGDQWNVDITAPIIGQSAYHVRTEGPNRLGWFAGNVGPDDLPTVLSAVLTGDPAIDAVTDYLFGGVAMLGTNTVSLYDELLDRNTSHILGAPVPGGVVYATATFAHEVTGATQFGNVIAGFPAGTAVRYGTNILGGYRMFFASGSREGETAPNAIPLYAGRENLTPAGEDIFLRAVQVAINNGAAPAVDPLSPVGFTSHPTSATVLENFPVTFSVSVTGAAPRTLQWQRDTGDGIFTDIPDVSTPFSRSSITITNVTLADDGDRFRVLAANQNGSAVSFVATLTVTPDTAPPVVLSAASLDGLTIAVCFNELLDNRIGDDNTAEDEFNYLINGAEVPAVATLRPDGRSVDLTLQTPVTANFVLAIQLVRDRIGNPIVGTVELTGAYPGLTSASVGAQNPSGSVFVCASNLFQITGGGVDLQNTTDQFQFLYHSVNGDFDARVRVSSLVGIDRLESVAKAILTARSTIDGGSAAVNVFLTPPVPADFSIASTFRPTAGGPTTTNAAPSTPNGLPNAWMRITRVGDAFTTYRSTDGNTWVQLGTATVALGSPALVGMGVNSHRGPAGQRLGRLAVGTFHDFRIIQAPAAPALTSPNYTGSAFRASFQTQSGVTYEVQRNGDLDPSTWMTFDTVVGDGLPYEINDSGSLPARRFYRVRAQ